MANPVLANFGQNHFWPLRSDVSWARRWGPEGWEAQQFACFFPLCVFSLNFGGFYTEWDPQMCRKGDTKRALGLSCETPAVPLPPGLHMRARELQTCTFQGPGASKQHQYSTRRPPERDKKSENGGGEKKRGPHPSGSHFFWVWAPTFQAPRSRPFVAIEGGPPPHTRSKNGWSKLDWPKLAKSGLPKRD